MSFTIPTVAEFAAELRLSPEALLRQLRNAGFNVEGVDAKLSASDKGKFLDYLRKRHGAADDGGAKRIALTRKSTVELRTADATDRAGRVLVVHKKRVLVVRSAEAPAVAGVPTPPAMQPGKAVLSAGLVAARESTDKHDPALRAAQEKEVFAKRARAGTGAETATSAPAVDSLLDAAAQDAPVTSRDSTGQESPTIQTEPKIGAAVPPGRMAAWQVLLRVLTFSAATERWSLQRQDKGQVDIAIYRDHDDPHKIIVRKTHRTNQSAGVAVGAASGSGISPTGRNEQLFGQTFNRLAAIRQLPLRVARLYPHHAFSDSWRQDQDFAGIDLNLLLQMIEASDQPQIVHDPMFHLSVWQGVLAALRDIHALDWVHADSKPDNFTLRPSHVEATDGDNTVRLTIAPTRDIYVIDFDLSLLDAEQRSRQLSSLRGVASSGYVSPRYSQQIQALYAARGRPGGSNAACEALQLIDWRVDLYSVAHFIRAWVNEFTPADHAAHTAAVHAARTNDGWAMLETVAQQLMQAHDQRPATSLVGVAPSLPHDALISNIERYLRERGQSGTYVITVPLAAAVAAQKPHRSRTRATTMLPSASEATARAGVSDPVSPAAPPRAVDAEADVYRSAQMLNTPQAWQAYLAAYPSGKFAAAAQAMIAMLTPAQPATAAPAAPAQATEPRAAASRLPEPKPVARPTSPLAAAEPGLLDGRYELVGDGSEVKDVETGLIWQRYCVGQRWQGNTCVGEAKRFTFDEAQKLAGNGWRLPTLRELVSLIWCSHGTTKKRLEFPFGGPPLAMGCVGKPGRDYVSPTIRPTAFPNSPASYVWSGSPYSGELADVWMVDFYDGHGLAGNKANGYGVVRLVHGGQ